jgi:hypothetical protein
LSCEMGCLGSRHTQSGHDRHFIASVQVPPPGSLLAEC